MMQQLLQRSLRGRQAGLLTLLAVLLLGGTPALEASHDHGTGAAYADCLLCKQTSDLPVVSAPGIPSVAYGHAAVDTPVVASATSRVFANYSPRGPPASS